MKPRIAVLGCGYWGSNHIRTLKALGALYAVSDTNRARAEGFASEQDCLAIEPDQLFVRDDIDAIVMALPPQFHADLAVRAVAAGKDVLVEKPIALTVADAERAVQAAKDNGRVFMVGHVLRFHPAFETLKGLIDKGELGEVRYIHSHRLGLGKFHTENDALWDLAPHDLSMILAITGTEPIEVRGEGAALLDNLSDFAHLHMRFPNGLRSHLFTSRLNPYRERRLTVVGTKAMAVFDDVEPWERKLAVYRHAVWQDSGQWAFTTNEPSYVAVAQGMPLTRELEHFIQCIETRAEPRTSGEEAIRVLRILTAGTVTHTKSNS
ncbi:MULTISPECIES: Gfo/Idh/MocA family oxidoreductase [unclassified Mesorhizobium]|uniref:Gfo/Idh/MocA family protein n=1 Tax=unclassified Mesorhizobium TaxID=325217 RepID=UPI000FCC13B7|nr:MULTISPECIES: Gfo/Idh/MocA family oxidoreductase [unclassified Mesorhizobium]RUU23943.1 Gfo/Idh/MocA family oxidoreductase [Mesorhizobium sp. M7A.T.Ca.TU.009.01.3.2]RUU64084.1 Gfo/Idh/MocA family oxidoreductase [Mesorhizobium sp. M7A.T.Ca.TU.009.01.1.1]RUU83382.1 Gfo/Idh/MocA family oxidoreductase [Mesorhizobium sp. M7A.T.Ca.TU.009.01.1.2]RUV10365.1 Gfo/Idh/MocA family oxidoreductase [Mesorhizobium sp. M7A.T.Ca.TU.009.01.3.1]RUV52041.1 Gfo/Idh/MocA family oxidoreductase [Mesorhizobium sp. M